MRSPNIATFSEPSKTRLIFLSFLMMFVELALIRWTGSNVVYLSYFSNFILLGSFLGIGLGFLRVKAKQDSFQYAPIFLALFVLLIYIHPVKIDRSGSDYIFFGAMEVKGLPIWFILPLIFCIVTGIMTMIGEGVGRVFCQFPTLMAYRLDILGSLAGIFCFTALSFLHAPPVTWGFIVAVIFIGLLFDKCKKDHWYFGIVIGMFSLMLLALLSESLDNHNYWSPYYKVIVLQEDSEPRYLISVNSIPHQELYPTNTVENHQQPYYAPYRHLKNKNLNRVLIIGAGTGNDTAIALAQGAKQVDAVEIDPVIQSLGKRLHPDHPFSNPRVTVYINDGRAYLQHSKQKYDLIIFALPDSLSVLSGQSSLRLESYLFTKEAIQTVYNHLTENGVFAMYNYYREPWLLDRLANTMNIVFKNPPCLDTRGQGIYSFSALTIAKNPMNLQCANIWKPVTLATAKPVTDNYPFLYLKTNSLPNLYLITLSLILGLSILSVGMIREARLHIKNYLDLFCMGVAFLLLETKSVVTFALLFGTTWLVNALVFSGVLGIIYLAIETPAKIKNYTKLSYCLLLLSLCVAWRIPADALLAFSFWPRFILAVGLNFLPIYFANLIFTQRFQYAKEPAAAFGANLIGSMIGGILEYSALIVGYRDLIILVGLFYTFAFILKARRLVNAT